MYILARFDVWTEGTGRIASVARTFGGDGYSIKDRVSAFPLWERLSRSPVLDDHKALSGEKESYAVQEIFC